MPSSALAFDAAAVLQTFVDTLKRMAANPSASLGSLIQQMPPTAPIPKSPLKETFHLAHTAFERYALGNPHRIAIRTAQGDLSYGDFNSRADCFAAHLLRSGVQHGEMIPLYRDKSADTLVAIFGILKAGAAFVPLDPHNPYERNKFIIGDIQAKRIVTDERNRDACEKFGLLVVMPEEARCPQGFVLVGTHGKTSSPAELGPGSVAYAIYTSGSTGLPKGVLVPHSAVDASTRGMVEATKVTAEWVALWVLNYIFDASYYDVFTIFSTGGILCVAPQDELLGDLAGHINSMGVEQAMLTPTITKLIRGGPAEVPRLKVLNVCGEKIDTNILRWTKHVDVYNGQVTYNT